MARVRAGEGDAALIIQTMYIGDVVLASALSRGLKRAYPGLRVDMLCEAGLDAFVRDNGIADAAIGFDSRRAGKPPLRRLREVADAARAVRRGGYRLVVDLTDGSTSQLLQAISGAPVRVGFAPPGKRLPLIGGLAATLRAPRSGTAGRHVLDRVLAPLEALGEDVSGLTPRLTPTAARQREAADLLAAAGLAPGGFVAVHPGARTAPRRWPPERFGRVLAQLAARTGLAVALVGGPDERPLAEAVAAACGPRATILAGLGPVAALPALLAQARLFLGNESGPMHVAAAVGVPVVGLFGLTDPAVWGPVSSRAIALRPSMPCACIRPDACQPADASRSWCVARLGEAEVLAALERLLAQTASPE